MTIGAKEALRRLGISEEVLLSREDIIYDELVRQCSQASAIPSIGLVAIAADMSEGSSKRALKVLIDAGRVIKIGRGLYIPIVDDPDDTG